MRKEMAYALRRTVPVACGYIFLGMAFGVLLSEAGYGPVWALCSSLFVYAGSMQFIMVSLLAAGAPVYTVAVTTFLVNARHIFYGLGMLEKFRGLGRRFPYMAFALTDETYSVLCSMDAPTGMDWADCAFYVSMFDQCYWVLGSLLGLAAGTQRSTVHRHRLFHDRPLRGHFRRSVEAVPLARARAHRPCLRGGGAAALWPGQLPAHRPHRGGGHPRRPAGKIGGEGMNAILIVAVTALVTIAVRLLPFAVFGKRPLPRAVVYLGRVLPPAIMAALVVYCLKGVDFTAWPFSLAEVIAVAGDGASAPLEAQHPSEHRRRNSLLHDPHPHRLSHIAFFSLWTKIIPTFSNLAHSF